MIICDKCKVLTRGGAKIYSQERDNMITLYLLVECTWTLGGEARYGASDSGCVDKKRFFPL